MSDDPPVAEMLEVAASGAPLLDRARAVVEHLEEWLPFAAIWLALCDPGSQVYATVGSSGWGQPGLDCLVPARFRDGLSLPLREPGGPFVGMLSLLFADRRPPSPALRDCISQVAPLIARSLSPLRSLLGTTGIVDGASAGAVLLRAGDTCPLPGFDGHPLLAGGSRVVEVAREMLLAGHAYRSFLWPQADADRPTGHARVTALSAHDVPAFLLGTVLITPLADCDLTTRELEVLGLIVDGRSNNEIARRLFVSSRTVATHVEHILHKLDVPSRTLAAITAEREGWYVPGRAAAL